MTDNWRDQAACNTPNVDPSWFDTDDHAIRWLPLAAWCDLLTLDRTFTAGKDRSGTVADSSQERSRPVLATPDRDLHRQPDIDRSGA